MISIKILLITIIITTTLSFHIQLAHPQSQLKCHLSIPSTDNIYQHQNVKNMLLYPYHIQQYDQKIDNNTKQTVYCFSKIPFSQLPTLLHPNTTTLLPQQPQLLYSLLPQIIKITNQPNERIQLTLLNNQLTNNIFIIKNQTNHHQSPQLHFLSLEPQQYLHFRIEQAQLLLKTNSTISQQLDQFTNQLNFSNINNQDNIQQAIQDKQKDILDQVRRKFIFQHILPSPSPLPHNPPPEQLCPLRHSIPIHPSTKWQAHLSNFHLKYFSATILQPDLHSPLKRLKLQSLSWSLQTLTQNTTIVQPLSDFPLTKISTLQTCTHKSIQTLLLSDQQKILLLKITNNNWQKLYYKTNTTNNTLQIFLDNNCNLKQLSFSTSTSIQTQQNNSTLQIISNNTQLSQLHPNKKNIKLLQAKNKMIFYQQVDPLHHLICWADTCFLYNHNLSTRITQIPHFEVDLTRKIHQLQQPYFSGQDLIYITTHLFQKITNSTLQTYITINTGWQQVQHLVTSIDLNHNSSFSLVPNIIYPYPTYFDKHNFTNIQMRRIALQNYIHTHRPTLPQITQIYHQLFLNNTTSCSYDKVNNIVQTHYQFDNSTQWISCSLPLPHKHSLNILQLSFQQILSPQFDIYLCQQYTIPPITSLNVKCKTLISQQTINDPSPIYPLDKDTNHNLFLIKSIPNLPAQSLPTIIVKDLEQQQIQIATTIFMVVVLTFLLLFFSFCCLYLSRKAIIALMIYHGHLQPRNQPIYPLNWLSLKSKLKRLTQIGVLKYQPYSQTTQSQQVNQCCFCIQNLQPNTTVAHLYCHHQFNKQCFNQWIKNQPNTRCPTCRRMFTRTAVQQFNNMIGSSQQLPL